MPLFIDQLQREIYVDESPKRIVSLVPSITELLADLKLNDEVVGITKFCVHPTEWFKTKTKTGGTKNIKVDVVASLKPDLIIANKEENVKEQIDAVEKIAPVFVTDVDDYTSALQMIKAIGEITNRINESKFILEKIKNEFEHFNPLQKKLRVCYLIWKDPYMTIGGDTFIHDMLTRCGFINVYANDKRYPEISINQLSSHNCQVVLLSSEPYPFKQKHINELKTYLPNTKIILVDGEMFSWYGSRLIVAPFYFKHLLAELNFDDAKL